MSTSGSGLAAAGEPSASAAGGESSTVGASATAGRRVVRKRAYEPVGRAHRVYPKFSDEEFEVVAVAAGLAGLTPAGFVARAALEVAAGRVRPAPAGAVEAMEVLSGAQLAVNRYGALLNQVVAKWHASGQEPGELAAVLGRAEGVLSRLDEAALGVIEVFGREAVMRRRARGRAAAGAAGPGTGVGEVEAEQRQS